MADRPKFWKQHDLEHLLQIGRARGAAGAALQADDAFDRGDVVETPAAEIVLEVDQLLGQLVEHPVALRIAVDGLPGDQDLFILGARLAPVRAPGVGADVEPVARQKQQGFVIERRLGQDRLQLAG